MDRTELDSGPTFGVQRRALISGYAPGAGRRRALADLTDEWVKELFHAADGEATGAALLATGGYGRRELSPGSDLDLLLLTPPGLRPERAGDLADRLWYPIWDSGISLDHAVRSAPQARRVASEDLRTLLALLDARHLAGAEALSSGLRESVLADWRAAAARRMLELVAATHERAARSGHVAFAAEPDLKEGRGGLRDLTVLRAITASWLADSQHTGLDEARNTLLDVRDALHLVSNRPTDRLVQQEQDAVAVEVGCSDRDQLMREVAAAGRTIAVALDLSCHRVERAVTTRRGRNRFVRTARRLPPRREREPVTEGVVEQDGEAVLALDARPAADPALVLRAAAAAAQRGIRLAPHAVQRLAAECPTLPHPWSSEARDCLVSLLGAGPATIPVWEALDQAGLIVQLLPDWERVRSRPQRNPAHRFTVDRHLLETAVQASRLTRRVGRPDLLLVGALLHDVGKGWPGDHTEAGVVIVRDLAPRIGFNSRDSAVLTAMVHHHLLLPDTATRRDLDDPATVSAVAAAVETVELLDLLHALAEADAIATGPVAWGDWKAELVADLVNRTRLELGGQKATLTSAPRMPSQEPGAGSVLTVSAAPVMHGLEITVVGPDRVGLLAVVAGVLSLHRLTVRSAEAHSSAGVAWQRWLVVPEFGGADDVASVREDVLRALSGRLDVGSRLAARDSQRATRAGGGAPSPRVEIATGASTDATVMEVRAHDSPGLLHRIAQELAAACVDVRSARVSTFGSEGVDVFYLVDGVGQALTDADALALGRRVRAALTAGARLDTADLVAGAERTRRIP